MNLDERMRDRLRVAADEAEMRRGKMDAATSELIVAAAQAEAKREKQRRSFRVYAGVGAATALAAGALVFVSQRASHPPDIATLPAPVAPRCMAQREIATVNLEGSDASRHELGSRARIDVAVGTRARIDAPSGCESRITLVSGSVTVWAKDLAGGALEVDAGDARVIVHGTVFEVRADQDGSRYVAVREGRVEVRRPAETRWLVSGQALTLPAHGAAQTASVDAAASAHLQAVLVDAPQVGSTPTVAAPVSAPSAVATVPSPTIDARATLRAAETAYRAGNVAEARRLFRQVGGLRSSMAEAAWIRLGRLELRAGHPAEAAQALAEHRRRFPAGTLAAEARVAEAQALRALGRGNEATNLEQWVIENRPGSPQAQALRARQRP